MTGGDVKEITYNHPTLGSGAFFPKSGEDSTFDPGGYRSDDDENGVDGSGEMIDKMNLKRWSCEVTLGSDMNTRVDLLRVSDLAESPVLASYTVTHVNGTVWAGKGKPVGDVKHNGNAATLPLKLAGSGRMKKIVG